MDRREAMQLALRCGVVLTASRYCPSVAAASAPRPGAEFHEGRLRGGMFEGWRALLSCTGARVRGTVFDPSTTGQARFTGYRVQGEQDGSSVELEFFDLADLSFSDAIGAGGGRTRRGKTTTRFELDGSALGALGKQDGKIVTRPTPLSRRRTGDLAGGYFVYLYRSDNNDYYGEFEAELTPNGRFTFRRLTLTGATGLPLEIAGRFAVGKDDAVYITTSMRGIAGASLDFDPSEVNKITAAEGAAIATGAGGLGIVSAFWTCVFGSCGADGFKTFEIAPASVVGGTNAVGVIELYRDAAQDLEIFLTSTNPLLVRVPASTTIVDGSDRGGFPVETSPVEQRTQVFVTGSYADFVEDAVITLEPQP